MKKKAQVIMLPTDKTSPIGYHLYKGGKSSIDYAPSFGFDVFDKSKNHMHRPQHLYIVTDDEIKEGDWYIYKDNFLDGTVKTQEQFDNASWNVSQCGENGEAGCHRAQFGKNAENGICGCYKIIATTDPELIVFTKLQSDLGDVNMQKAQRLPQPSKAFIEKWCKTPVDEVDVEYEKDTIGGHGMTLDGEFGFIYENPKVDSHNTITIHPIKDSWSREEVKGLCKEAFSHGVRLWEDWERDDWEMWRKFKKENL